ncbi:hypothetical protein [Halobaculum marinum]|uniref:Uncharacterized protein n=1 Tax=Halobaculum marinum TaxID=3031996 RepID=A0ABD5WWK8_9EURY|nr:hypothetical protein [Halobaculum sp. DT55]
MWVRERDVVDYLTVSVVTLLAWLHFPYSTYVYTQLHYWAWWIQRWVDQSPDQAVGLTVVVFAIGGGALLAGIVYSASA